MAAGRLSEPLAVAVFLDRFSGRGLVGGSHAAAAARAIPANAGGGPTAIGRMASDAAGALGAGRGVSTLYRQYDASEAALAEGPGARGSACTYRRSQRRNDKSVQMAATASVSRVQLP